MWILTFLFLVTTLSICWVLFGFLLWNFFGGMLVKRTELELPESFPSVTILIPTYNEEAQILEKLADTLALDYPGDRLRIVFADGQSTDRTTELLEEATRDHAQVSVVRCPRGGKIHQLNHVLQSVDTDLVVNTDADARLELDCLKWLAAEFADDQVWVAGAFCNPEGGLKVEQHYWDGQNKARLMETRIKTSSIVVAPCYAFRRALFDTFPEDVVADDIYVAFLCNTLGRRTVYSSKAVCREVRVPGTLDDFLPQKFRKSNAYLRESLRFAYRLPEMDGYNRVMHLTRVVRQLLMPWLGLGWIAIAASLLTVSIEGAPWGRVDLVGFGAGLLLFFFLLTGWAFQRVRPPVQGRRYSIFTMIYGYILINLILLITGFTYPFYKQGSSYARISMPGSGDSG